MVGFCVYAHLPLYIKEASKPGLIVTTYALPAIQVRAKKARTGYRKAAQTAHPVTKKCFASQRLAAIVIAFTPSNPIHLG